MIVFCPAKINLGLRILEKREDGYHSIESVFYPIPLYDVLEFVPTDQFQFKTTGLEIPGDHEDNLILKTYRMLKADFKLPPLNMHLLKKIPMGGGLGGGSSDVAHFIRGLNKMENLGLTIQDMEQYASRIGSDCPFFIQDQPQLVQGRGEILKPIDLNLSDYSIVLIFPNIHISTPKAYAGVIPKKEGLSVSATINNTISEWKSDLVNDFENHIFELYPQLKEIKSRLYEKGAVYASMSGSGATMYGLFDKNTLQPDIDLGYPSKLLSL